MSLFAIDVSQYSDEVALADWRGALQAGLGHAVVRLSTDTPANRALAVRQLASAGRAGLSVSGYVMCDWDQVPSAQVDLALSIGTEAGVNLATLWLDVEERLSVGADQILPWLRKAATHAAEQSVRPGIYTNLGSWSRLGNPSALNDLPLWAADWDGQADRNVAHAVGGWTRPYAGKQYSANLTWSNIWCDLDIFDEACCVPLQGHEDPMPPIPQHYIDQFSLSGAYDLQGLIDNLEGVATTRYEQGKAEGLSLGRIPPQYVSKFTLNDDHDVIGLIDNLEGVGQTKYQQGYADGLAARPAPAVPATP